MKPRILVLALVTALGTGCASTEKPRLAYQVSAVSSVSHGAPNAQSFYQVARYYHGQKRLMQAEEAYLKAIALDSRQVDAYNALGSLYAERGELDRSVEQFEIAVSMAPDAGYIHNNLGFAYFLQGRLDEAYASVRKAVTLHAGLERGWVNLEQIAKAHAVVTLAEAVKLRQVDALPTTLLATTDSDKAIPEAAPGAAVVADAAPSSARVEPSPDSLASNGGGVGGNVETSIGTGTVAAVAQSAHVAEPVSVAVVAVPSEHVPPALIVESTIENGKFVLVSTQRAVVDLAEPTPVAVVAAATETELPSVALAVLAGTAEPRAEPMAEPVAESARDHTSGARPSRVCLEVSNGNGVTGFARKFSAQLRHDGIPVSRITNHFSYLLKETVIEYQPGFEGAARAVMSHTKLDAQLVPAKEMRPRSDVRILLGRNALPSNKI